MTVVSLVDSPPLVQRLVVDDGWFRVEVGSLVFRHFGKMPHLSFNRCLESIPMDCEGLSPGRRRALLVEFGADHGGITAAQRKMVAANLKQNEVIMSQRVSGLGLVAASPLLRGMVTAVFWIAPPPHPHIVVGARPTALHFLKGLQTDLDVIGTLEVCESLCRQHGLPPRAPSTLRHHDIGR